MSFMGTVHAKQSGTLGSILKTTEKKKSRKEEGGTEESRPC